MRIDDTFISQRLGESQVRFFHAENLQHFRRYCDAGAVLCRSELMRGAPAGRYTHFYSDPEDARLGVLQRVFGNIYDFGAIFGRASRSGAVPNVYGPISFSFRSSVFAGMRDIAITPQSIVNLGHGWRGEAVSTAEELDEMLQGDAYRSPIHERWHYSELSCANGQLPFEQLECVLVEPIDVLGMRLSALVENELRHRGFSVPVVERRYRDSTSLAMMGELVRFCEGLRLPATQEQWSLNDALLPASFRRLSPEKRKRVLLWCRYFCFGTLEPLRRDAEGAQWTAPF